MKSITAIVIFFVIVLLFKNFSEKPARILQAQKDREWIKNNPPKSKAGVYPVKTAAYWTSPIMNPNDVIALAKHHIVIIDLENQFNNRESLLTLKSLNPHILLFAYSNPMEVHLKRYLNRPWQNQVREEIFANRKAWFLRTIDYDNPDAPDEFAHFYPGMAMLNLSTTCPRQYFQKYPNWMASKIKDEILSDPIWDGYFLDNCTANIAWITNNSHRVIDIKGNGELKSRGYINRKWERGMDDYLAIIRKTGLPVIGNKGDLNFRDKVFGKLFEKFPNDYLGSKWAGGWLQCVSNAAYTGPYTIFQVERDDLMFGLCSTLLLDNVFLAVGQDDAEIFPELNIKLGKALGKMKFRGDTFYRDFENGRVLVEPLKKHGEIKFKAGI